MTDGAGVCSTGPRDLFEAAKRAHVAGDLPTAESGYGAALAQAESCKAPTFDDTVKRARWNLATIYEGRDEIERAADTLQPLRRSPAGEVNPDPELHLRYAQLRYRQYDQRAETGEFGAEVAALRDGRIEYEPSLFTALREGVRGYLDVRESLALPGARAALGEETAKAFEREAEIGIARGPVTHFAFVGTIFEAANGRLMTADRDAVVKRMEARGQVVPAQYKGRLGITEGPLADAMESRTEQLREDVRRAGIENMTYTAMWRQWEGRQRKRGLQF